MVFMSDEVTVVLALKELTRAKSRLAASRSAARREALVAAMFVDTVTAAQSAGAAGVIVVSPDRRVRDLARSLGVLPVDEPGGSAGLNSALAHGAARADPASAVAYLQADLPALTAESLRAALAAASAASAAPAAFVADRSGSGTALLVVGPRVSLAPAFGADSAAAHRAAGAAELDPRRTRWADLRCDVDTEDDLRAAVTLGVGAATAAAAAIGEATDRTTRDLLR